MTQQMLHSCLRVRGYEDKTVNRDNMENEKPHVWGGLSETWTHLSIID